MAIEFEDEVEIQHVGRGHVPVVRTCSSMKSTSSGSNRSHRCRKHQSLSSNSTNPNRIQMNPELYDDDNDDTVVRKTLTSDSEDQDTMLDNFTSLCLPFCAPHCIVPPKSALKKPGSGQGEIKPQHSVSFNSLRVREYEITLGDHPSSASGPPIQLDWEPKKESVLDLDQYENERLPRKSRRQLKMSFMEREEILQSRGYTMDELKNAWMEALKIRQQRYETIRTGTLTSKVEEAWESACRKFNRFFTLTQDMEGYEVKAAGDSGGQEAYAYVHKTDDNEKFPASSTPPTTSIWSVFEYNQPNCGSPSSSSSSMSSWLVDPCTGSTRFVS